MREVYRGNGFIVETNDCEELFIALESKPNEKLRIATSGAHHISLSYTNTSMDMVPLGYKNLSFGS